MSDWNMYEIEDVVWDVFGACSDHIVPHPNGNSVNEVKAQHDTNKKARPDLRNTADDIADKAGRGEHNIFQEIVFNSSLENYQGNVGHLSHKTSDIDIAFRNGENMEMKNSDILDCQWPEFDDIGDVDYMLRHGYTTFGQGGGGTANELSWFTSSSYTIDDSDDVIKSSMQSSCSELNVLKSYSKHPEASMTGWPEKVTTIDNHEESCLDYDSYSQWLDADAQNLLVSEKLSNGYATGGSHLLSNIDHSDPNCRDTFQVNNDRNMSMSSQIDGIEVDQNSGYFSGSYNSTGQSACYDRKLDNSLKTFTSESYTNGMEGDSIQTGTHSSNHISLDGSNLEVMHIASSHMEIEPSEPNEFLDQSQTLIKSAKVMATKLEKLTATDMKPKLQYEDTQKNTKSSSPIVNSSERKISERVSSKSNAVENKLEIMESHTGGGNQLGIQDAVMASSTEEINNSSLQGSSCTASSGSILSGSSSLQKLQEVTSQLDIKTKLCIRDGLYRLARNAEKRHNPDVIRYGCKEEMITSNIMVANDSHRIPRLLYEETGTNPIDRSIAHLLFYKASGHCVGPADDAMSV